MGHFGGGGLIW